MSNTSNLKVTFAAIDPYLTTNIVSPKEVNLKGKDRVQWGEKNAYPEYLLDLFKSVPTLRSIITGSADFVAGDDVTSSRPLNLRKDLPREVVHNLGLDFFLYGGFALQVIRDKKGDVAEIYYCDIRFLRTDKDNEVFYYSEKWTEGGRDAIVYPKFYPYKAEQWSKLTPEEKARNASSIYYYKDTHTQAYPSPCWAAAVKACEQERGIDDYHLNALENGFTSSMLVNFNQGVPSDEIKNEIERSFTEKFTGHQNAGRVMFSWNDSKDTMTTMQSVKVEDFGERYNSLAKHARQQIFTAFRAVPALFGLMNETTGFSEQEFAEAFKLYNRTRIKPVQRNITEAVEKIFGESVIEITPFEVEVNKSNAPVAEEKPVE